MKRTAFTFSLRDLLWLILAASLAVGWWSERAQRSKQEAIAEHVEIRLQATRRELQTTKTMLHDTEGDLLRRLNRH